MNEKMNIEKWAADACRKIAFLPDRRAMERELTDHFEDHRDALLDGGMSAADAEELALRAMGDAREISDQLAQVYNTLWTRLWRFSRGALWALVILLLLFRATLRWTSPYKADYFDFGFRDADTQAYYSREMLDEYNAGFTDETIGKQLVLTNWTVGTSNAQDTYMDFDWSVEKWARFHEVFEMNDILPEEGEPPAPVESDQCVVLLRVQDHAVYPGDVDFHYSDFHVVDSLGNRYYNTKQAWTLLGRNDSEFSWYVQPRGRVWNRYYIELRLEGTSPETEWIELRAGEEDGLCMRIDLTSGEVLG